MTLETYVGSPQDSEKIPDTDDKRWDFETTDSREILFKHMVEDQIMTAYEKDLSELSVSNKSIENLEDALIDQSITERDREIFYCIPYELRIRQFQSNLPKKKEGEDITTDEWISFVKDMIDINKDSEPHIGFHVSTYDIKKDKKPQGATREEWTIKGTEIDNRNDDHAMAYYSLSIDKIFSQKGLKHLYVIRANLANGYNHYPDNNGHWGRSASLSVITKIDLNGMNLNELMDNIEEKLRQMNKNNLEM